jgi:hypothetical protein
MLQGGCRGEVWCGPGQVTCGRCCRMMSSVLVAASCWVWSYTLMCWMDSITEATVKDSAWEGKGDGGGRRQASKQGSKGAHAKGEDICSVQ